MYRNALAALVLTLLIAQPGTAQEWARKMFQGTTEHDFGTVARGAKTIYSFKFKNLYKETVHVAGVRSSCGCSSASVKDETVRTLEFGEIPIELNTRSFLGYRSATITVTFDEPFPAEVQLQVSGHIRGDVVFYPGLVQFGTVDEGTAAEQRVTVTHAGRADWQVVDVLSANPHFEVEVNPAGGQGQRVTYQMLVRLKDDAPAGYVNDQLIVVTNDAGAQQIPLAVEGRVTPELTVNPTSLYLGNLAEGQAVTKQLVVRGKHPFKIVEVSSDDNRFTFHTEQKNETLYLVGVTFQADGAGSVDRAINIRTDRGEGITAKLIAHAVVTPSGGELEAPLGDSDQP